MSKFEERGATAAPGKFYYQICKHCKAHVHIDNLRCGKCGKRVRDIGERGRIYQTSEDPKLVRHNLDFENGCPACSASCSYCHSFGVPEPSPKAYCSGCDKWRAVCCMKARKLELGFDTEKIAGCRSHVPDTGSEEFPPREKIA
jgi:ribosomal protein L40E